MQIVFRADSSFVIGSGHIRRCLLLAEKFAQRGASILFLTRNLPMNCNHLIVQQGYGLRIIGNASDDVRKAEEHNPSWFEDAKRCLDLIKKEGTRPTLLVVDQYGLSAPWEQAMRQDLDKILVIDDLANRPHYADALLDQNYRPTGTADYSKLVNKSCRLFLGPNYLLLRDEFSFIRPPRNTDSPSLPFVFVFFGSTDPADATSSLLIALRAHPLAQKLRFKVLVGLENPGRARVRALAGSMQNVELIEGSDNMAEVIYSCDFALGAGGTTTWERCAMGVASVVVAIAKNQELLSRLLAEAGVILYAGATSSPGWANEALSALARLYEDTTLKTQLSAAGLNLVSPNRVEQLLDWAMIS